MPDKRDTPVHHTRLKRCQPPPNTGFGETAPRGAYPLPGQQGNPLPFSLESLRSANDWEYSDTRRQLSFKAMKKRGAGIKDGQHNKGAR